MATRPALFMGAVGLRIIEAATDRLGRTRSGLSLRAPSAQVRQLLDITGVTEKVHVDDGDDVNPVEEDEGAEVVGERTVTVDSPRWPSATRPCSPPRS